MHLLLHGALVLGSAAVVGCFDPEGPDVANADVPTDGGSGSATDTSTTSGESPRATASGVSSGNPGVDDSTSSPVATDSTSHETSGGCQTGVFGTAMFGAACFS